MYFYSAQVEAINRDRLKTNEMLLQNTVTRSLADDLSQHEAHNLILVRSDTAVVTEYRFCALLRRRLVGAIVS